MGQRELLESLRRRIADEGKFPGGSEYMRALAEFRERPEGGGDVEVVQQKLVVGDVTFEKSVVEWNRKDAAIALAAFVNAASPLGLCIKNIKAGDVVRFHSGTGIASFAKDKGNPLAESIVGIVGAEASVAAALTGFDKASAPINELTKQAQSLFKATNAATKRRDIFGEDDSGQKARQEGGILISLPEAQGAWFSGRSESRWIKEPGDRTDANMPSHVAFAFFPRRSDANHNTRTATIDGEIFVTPWDWKFEDNAGFYLANLSVAQGQLEVARANEGDLIKSPDDPTVFLIENGQRRSVANEATFLSRWTWDQVRELPAETVNAIPRGPDLPSIV